MTPYRYYFAVTQESVGATVWLTIPASDTEPCTFQLYRNGQPESAPFTEEQILDVWQCPGVQLYTQYNLWRAVNHLSKLLEQDGRLEDAGRCHLRLLPYAPNYLALYDISGAVLRLANETGRFIQVARDRAKGIPPVLAVADAFFRSSRSWLHRFLAKVDGTLNVDRQRH